MTQSTPGDLARHFAEVFCRDHRTIYTRDGDRVDLQELAFTFQHIIDEYVATNTTGTKVQPCDNCREKARHHMVGCPVGPLETEEHLEHVPCVITRYNLTDDEWDATPHTLKLALLLECSSRE